MPLKSLPPSVSESEPEQAYTCDICEVPIYEGDTYYSITEDIAICEDCRRSRRRTAEVM